MSPGVRTFVTYALIAVGGLITALCGSCTGVFLIMGLASNDPQSYGQAMAVMALIIGGLPTLVGVLLLWLGLRRRKRARARDVETFD